MRTKAARDANEADIVATLREAGYFVTHLNDPGVPDLLVIRPDEINKDRIRIVTTVEEALQAARAGMITLLEVKQPGKPLRPLQLEWHNKAMGR